MGQYDEAEAHLQKGLTDFKELEDQRMVAYCYARLGFIYCRIKPNQAEKMLQSALSIAYNLDIEPCILEILFGYAYLYLNVENVVEAIKLKEYAKHHPKSNQEIQLWAKILEPQIENFSLLAELHEPLRKEDNVQLNEIAKKLLTENFKNAEWELEKQVGQ